MSESNKITPENKLKPVEKWYSSWFNTPYYHLLYKDRDYKEAQIFIDNITHYLNLPEKAKVLDLACGRGRHSIYLNQLGFDVLGADLSQNSISLATAHTNDTLHFKVHDMRQPFEQKYDAIFNLFTSFGYFENEQDNLITLKAIKESLSEYGFAVIDFMNVTKVLNTLNLEEMKTVNEIDFYIKRYQKDGYIYKEIDFHDQGEHFHFIEKVKALTLKNFEELMEEAGIYLLDVFGDYKLKKFHPTDSDRLIMIFK